MPHRLWVRLRGRVKAFPLEKVRLATLDEVASSDFVSDALKQVEEELQGGKLLVDETENPEDLGEPQPSRPARKADSSSSSSSTSEAEGVDRRGDSEAEQRERRAKLLDDVPLAMTKLADRRKAEEAELAQDPHALDFAKKRKLFERLAKDLLKGQIRDHLSQIYGKFKEVRKVLQKPKGGGRVRGGGKAGVNAEANRHARGVLAVEDLDLSLYRRPGEHEAMLTDTLGYWTLWSGTSTQSGHEDMLKVVATLRTAEQEAMSEGVTEVKTGKARIEYRWSALDEEWRRAFVEPLKKAVGVYLEHNGIKGVPRGQVVDPKRVLSSRFVLTNKGEEALHAAELKARWIFGGHRDPDAGMPLAPPRQAPWLTTSSTSWQCSAAGLCTTRMSVLRFCKGRVCLGPRRFSSKCRAGTRRRSWPAWSKAWVATFVVTWWS